MCIAIQEAEAGGLRLSKIVSKKSNVNPSTHVRQACNNLLLTLREPGAFYFLRALHSNTHKPILLNSSYTNLKFIKWINKRGKKV